MSSSCPQKDVHEKRRRSGDKNTTLTSRSSSWMLAQIPWLKSEQNASRTCALKLEDCNLIQLMHKNFSQLMRMENESESYFYHPPRYVMRCSKLTAFSNGILCYFFFICDCRYYKMDCTYLYELSNNQIWNSFKMMTTLSWVTITALDPKNKSKLQDIVLFRQNLLPKIEFAFNVRPFFL